MPTYLLSASILCKEEAFCVPDMIIADRLFSFLLSYSLCSQKEISIVKK